jgi:hypothetical protein
VFEHLGVPILQHRIHRFDHGDWMDWVLHYHKQVEVFLFADADAFPLSHFAIIEALEKGARGALYGNAQVSHHIDPTRLFVAPSWCSLSRETWIAIGCPSARADNLHDVGQRWTQRMLECGMVVEMLRPRSCVKPLWTLPNGDNYGIATQFESTSGAANFHLFGVGGISFNDPQYSRDARIKLLEEEADRVCAQPTAIRK